MNMENWTFEQMMMVPSMYAFPYPPPNISPAGEYWQGPQTPSPQHTAYFHYPSLPPDNPPLLKLQPPQHRSSAHPTTRLLASPPLAAIPPSRAVVPASGQSSATNSAEHNRLNLIIGRAAAVRLRFACAPRFATPRHVDACLAQNKV
ncbi:hypothetical protein B0H14DRAFT_3514515 [Mycena olivaceomarginata]|nr:hypothetical protein B0H14DRAFT_3514515 [Mycena olivaceomarginata]